MRPSQNRRLTSKEDRARTAELKVSDNIDTIKKRDSGKRNVLAPVERAICEIFV